MLENIEVCPICENTSFEPFLSCKDYTVSGEIFTLQKCSACDFVLTSPRPFQAFLGNYYKSENYISHSDTQKGLVNKMYHWIRKIALKRKLRLIERLHHFQKGKLLDFGCGTGYFLKTALQAGWQAEGIEPDENARKIASENANKPVFTSLQEIRKAQFDIITLWHVLEHIPKLNETLSELKSLLKPTGKLVIALPNRESQDAQVFGAFWAAYDVPRHLWHFSKKDILALSQKHYLQIQEILPMPFDAYYISLMSTLYQTGKTQFLRAFWQGFLSNLKAGKQNTSSLIYVLKIN